MSLYRELAIPGDKSLPRQRSGPLKECVEVSGWEGPQHQQHPLPGAQVHIQPRDIPQRSTTEDAAVLRPHLGQIQTAQFIGSQALQAEQSRDGKGQCFIHVKKPPRPPAVLVRWSRARFPGGAAALIRTSISEPAGFRNTFRPCRIRAGAKKRARRSADAWEPARAATEGTD